MEGILLLAFIIWIIYMCTKKSEPAQTQITAQQSMDRNMICPHCQTKGSVTTQQVKKKIGISGGKATAAVLTCGISMLGTGLSRKQKMTEASCGRCGATWSY
uniref:Putative transcription elongation protein n=1 Tax=viral metagenome TaxID=1070528 RepID=A0A6H2A635_9ZZZZ